MERLLIDTDPGVDDAQAILMAAAHPGARIEALLAVSGNVSLADTSRNALAIAETLRLDVPVYAGCEEPLVMPAAPYAVVHGQDGLGDAGLRPAERRLEAEHAAVALVRLARTEPEAFTLVALGPLTNIAVALRLEPRLPALLKRTIVMGGAVTGRGNTVQVSAEFNMLADPEAAHVVFEGWHAASRRLELVDWELTVRHAIPASTLTRWLALDTPRGRFFQAITAGTLRYVKEKGGRDHLYAADPLTMAVVLEPAIVRRRALRHVMVEMSGSVTRGQTTVDWDERLGLAPNADIVLEIDQARFLELFEAGLL